jgi:hypothetical protein
MDYQVGIDASLHEQRMHDRRPGSIARETKVTSEPRSLITFCQGARPPLARVGIEADLCRSPFLDQRISCNLVSLGGRQRGRSPARTSCLSGTGI